MTSDPDLFLVLGLVIGLLSFPAIFRSIMNSEAPRVAAVTMMIAGVLIVLAYSQKPGGYGASGIADAFSSVIGRLL